MWVAILRYIIRHAIAAGAVVIGCGILTVLAYFGLLVWAVIANKPVGSPVALPFWLLILLVVAVITVLVVLWPVTSISELVSRGAGRGRIAVQLTAALLLLFVEVSIMGLLYAVIWKQPVSRGLAYGVTTGVVLLIPLGVYWSMLQVTEGVISFISSVWRWLRQPHVAP